MRKSPTQARAEHTVDAILEAAAQILQSDGEEKLNTNRIAERAGFSIGTLYQYFADKEAIIAALAERERDKVLATIVKAMSSVESDDAEKVTREIVRTMIGSFAKRKRARRIIMMTMLKRWQFAPDKQGTGVIEQILVETSGRGHNSGHRVMTRHMIGQYAKVWPNHPFTFYIPYQKFGGISSAREEYIQTPPDIVESQASLQRRRRIRIEAVLHHNRN